jgi:hypothetical protein
MAASVQPTIAISYGVPGSGKTTAAIGSGAEGAFYAKKSALECQSFFDIDLGGRCVEPTNGLTGAINFTRKYGDKVSILTFDDMQYIIEQEKLILQARESNGFKVFDLLYKKVMQLVDVIENVSAYAHFTHHEKAPRVGGKKDKEGNPIEGQSFQIKGVPMVPGYQLPDSYPGFASIVARAVWDENLGGSWPYVYQVGPDPSWVTKDRTDKLSTAGRIPMNMAEALAYTGRAIGRPKGFEWMEKYVEATAVALLVPDAIADEVLKKYGEVALKKALQQKGGTWRHARWVLWDAHARAFLRKANSAEEGLSSFVSRLASSGSPL